VTRPNQPRGQLRPAPRAGSATPGSERTLYTRRTRLIGEMVEVTEAFVIQESPIPEPANEPTPEPVVQDTVPSYLETEIPTAAQEEVAETPEEPKQEKDRRRNLRRLGLILIASVIILATGYVGIDTLLTNNRVKADTSKQPTQQAATGELVKAEEGTDEAKPAENALTNYSVAPSLPRALYINSIGVASRIIPMSVNTDGSIQAPRNIFDAGWYNASVKPGEPGAVFIDGHASGATRAGLFAYLDKLKVGDQLQIEKGDGSKLNYKVVHAEVTKLDEVDMKKVLTPYEGVSRGLNLMTCTGEWVDDKQTYDHRVIVWAEQV